MKKFIALITLCLSLGFTACGEEEQPTGNSGSANTSQESQEASKPAVIEAKPEVINASWDSGLIQINDTLVQLPMHLSDWLALGFDYNVWTITKDGTKEHLFAPDEHIKLELLVDCEPICITSDLKNTTDSYATAEECDPLIETLTIASKDVLMNKMFFPGNLTFDSSLKELEGAFGKPGEIEDSLTYSSFCNRYGVFTWYTNCGLYAWVDKNTQKISQIKIGKNIDSCKYDELISAEHNVVPSSWGTTPKPITFSWFPEYRTDDNLKNNIYSIVEYNGTKYMLTLESNLFQKNKKNDSYFDPVIFEEVDENGAIRRITSRNADHTYGLIYASDNFCYMGTFKYQNLTHVDEDADTLHKNFEEVAITLVRSIYVPD